MAMGKDESSCGVFSQRDVEIPAGSQRASSAHKYGGSSACNVHWMYIVLMASAYILLAAWSIRHLYSVPPQLPASASDSIFTEGRALALVQELAGNIRERQVGSKGYGDAAAHLLQFLKTLKDHADRSRPDISLEVLQEQTSGTFDQTFVHHRFLNSYKNLTNVVLRIAPKMRSSGAKSLLVSAHFDSTLGTAGASDAMSCVATILEAARTIVHNPNITLHAPVILLLNGGEETLLQAAHGYVEQGKWASELGAFINLESTGADGPDYLFQHAGDWTVEAYKRAAVHPRGTVVAQDFFDMNLLPAGTDYEIFRDYAGLPGLDIAFLLGAEVYHTHQDTWDRIRPGTLQAMGENLISLIEEFTRVLREQGESPVDTATDVTAVYFDVAGKYMVAYTKKLARQLHCVPFALAMAVPLLLPRVSHGAPPMYASVAWEASLSLLAMVAAVVFPAAQGALRIALTGQPMAWFGAFALPFAMYMPISLAGALSTRLIAGTDPIIATVGNALMTGAFATLITGVLGHGFGFIFAIWSTAGLLAVFLACQVRQLGHQLVCALACATMAAAVMLPGCLALTLHLLQKASFVGAVEPAALQPYVVDTALGGLLGLSTLTVVGYMVPWLAVACGRRLKEVILGLLAISLVASMGCHVWHSAYSVAAPKKIYVQHLHQVSTTGVVERSSWTVAGIDAVPVERILPADLNWTSLTRAESTWLSMFPVSSVLQSAAAEASGPDAAVVQGVPRLDLHLRESLAGGSQRLHLHLKLQQEGMFGAMRLDGPLTAWSLAPAIWAGSKVVRFAGNQGSDMWAFWVDMPGNATLAVQACASLGRIGSEGQRLTAAMPDFTSAAVLTTYCVTRTF